MNTLAAVEVAPFIDGCSQDSASHSRAEVINPSTGTKIFEIPQGCIEDVNQAVDSARRSFESGGWSQAAPSVRRHALNRLAEAIHRSAQGLDELDAAEMGKPISETFCNAAGAADLLRFCAAALEQVLGDVYQSDQRSFVTQRWVPRGVVAAIVPWNFPTYVAIQKLAPALAAGNSVVLKPSELSSRSALSIARLAIEAGIPPGVLNVIPGVGSIVGAALGKHADVDMMTFTGSTAVGKLMLQYAGQSNMKVVMAECGGKSPQIVFADGIDVNHAADSIAKSILTNQGQICSVGSRILVQREIEATLIDRIVDRFKDAVIGDALDPATTFGPISSHRQYQRVIDYIESAKSAGADLVVGGRRIHNVSGGYFIEPTVFRNVSPAAPIAREEVFGPVLSVIPFASTQEAIRIANSTLYGLAAYVWTANLCTAMQLAKGIRSSVAIYGAPPSGEGAGHTVSWEPSGQSGVGTEGGIAGLQSYLRRQLVEIYHA
jgi:acyl-CoA reductase-like NAD-dependent aldehyde dehydrogenase